MLPAIWSFVEGVLRQSRIKVPLVIQALLDFASVTWLGLYIIGLLISSLLQASTAFFIDAVLFIVAL